MSTANRVIKNTGFLYAKMGITMFISLYSTRLILNALGTTDFGVYSVVGGLIAMLGFLHVAMAGATQRFMSFYQGKKDKNMQKQIFNISLVLHFAISILLGVVLLIAGYFFFNGILNIPIDRIYAAKVVFISLIVSTMFTVMSVPYEAVLNAHENMLYYSIVGVLESLLKLSVALIIVYYDGDKLELYGILMACIPLLVLTIMRVYCHKKYSECKIAPKKYWDVKLMKEMTSFAGWGLLATSASILNNYGRGIILNSFFGTRLNAAQGISSQISGQVGALSGVMLKALRPVIIKSEGDGDRGKMINATLSGSKISFFLYWILTLPAVLEMPYILKFWLKNVPEYSLEFCRLFILSTLIEQIFITIPIAISASGKIKELKITVSILGFVSLFFTYYFFYLGFKPVTMYYILIVLVIVRSLFVLFFANKHCDLAYSTFVKKVLIPVILVVLFSTIISILPEIYITNDFFRFVSVVATATISTVVAILVFGLNKIEKKQFEPLVNKIKNRFVKKI